MLVCSISGQPTSDPVLSPKSGAIFDRKLVTSYIESNSTDPVSGQNLTIDELIPVKSSHAVTPRPPSLTSIPSLLSAFQTEWDAVALETFSLKQQLLQARQDLSAALYRQDAAVRVASRLLQERDEARQALTRLTESLGSGTQAMEIDTKRPDKGGSLSKDLSELIRTTHVELSAHRKARKGKPLVDFAAPQDISGFSLQKSTEVPKSEAGASISAAAVHPQSGKTLIATTETKAGPGELIVYSHEEEILTSIELQAGFFIKYLVWIDEGLAVLATKSGQVSLVKYDGSSTVSVGETLSSGDGVVNGVAVHPSKKFIAVARESTFEFYILDNRGIDEPAYVSNSSSGGIRCIEFHPDGQLLAVGTEGKTIDIYQLASGESNSVDLAATFEGHKGSVDNITFSENGYWMASGGTDFKLWHLGKGAQVQTKGLDFNLSQFDSLEFDPSGQYIAGGGSSKDPERSKEVYIYGYDKSAKAWEMLYMASEFQPSDCCVVEWLPNSRGFLGFSGGNIAAFA